MAPWQAILIALAGGYVCGSIPFGLVLTRMAGLGDVRAIGSGSIGATNVLRTGRRDLAALTLLLDALKGLVPTLVALRYVGPDAALGAAACALIGHCFPVWLRFQGGKGVATFIGCLLGLDWRLVPVFAVLWLAVAAATRYSSLASLTASAAVPLAAWWLTGPSVALVLVGLVVIVFAQHRANIGRLQAGTESRIGRKA